jgi:hypothetical protein
MLTPILTCGVLVLTSLSYAVGPQTTGSIKGTVTDQLGSLVTNARVILKDDRGSTTSITTNSVGFYEFKILRPGLYELRVVAPGFVAYEQKGIVVEARQTTTADVPLSLELEEQQVTVDGRSVSTDSDNNANASCCAVAILRRYQMIRQR